MPDIALNLIRDQKATFDATHRRKDGTKFPVEISIHVFLLRGRKVALSFNRDITGRREAEGALRRNEMLLRQAEEVGRSGELGVPDDGTYCYRD